MLKIASQITFLYYKDLSTAQHFYEKIMGFKLAEDQGWAKIYRISGNAFVGLVDETRGSLKVQENSAVMLTLVSNDVRGWYDYLKSQDVEFVREFGISDEIQIEYFFIRDPGGYIIEIEKFLKPELAETFGLA
ncbi:MAG: VOC family protein [Ardenticatenaceae bacterium]|nr:VOC family protein [Ardenticatenaceae bacterium]